MITVAQALTIPQLCEESHQTASDKGWWEEECNVGEKLMLIVTELAEAMEDVRNSDIDISKMYFEIKDPQFADEIGRVVPATDYLWDLFWKNPQHYKPVGFPSELADVLIRIGDLCGFLGINLDQAVQAKFVYNKTRKYRHGGKLA